MTDKKEVSILLLGIVAILAIVGLVLLFTSPVATGKAWFPPALPPILEAQFPVESGQVIVGGEYGMSRGQIGNAIIITTLSGANLPRCPNGRVRTREMGNIPYEAIPGYFCNWFFCPGLEGSSDPSVTPIMACVPR